nr:hypothetical protein [Tanacetum cinerariifolium]
EDPKEYEDDETKDGLVDYPMDGGDDDGDSSGDDTDDEDENDEDEEEEEHLASTDSVVVIPTDELASISLPPKAEVERLLAMPTPSPLTSLSPPSAGERLARCTTPAALPSLPLPPPLHMPPPIDRRDDIPGIEMSPRKRLCLSTLGSRYEMHQTEIAELRETDRRRQTQMAETLRVLGDMRREMGDMQSELLALRGQPRRVGQPGGDARVPNHQDAPRDASSPPPVSVAPMVSHFLCLDDLESDTKIPKRHVSPTPHNAMLTRWRKVEVNVVARIDIPNGMLMPDTIERLEQRELEARRMINSRERASLLDQVVSLERSNARLQGTMMMERARANRF